MYSININFTKHALENEKNNVILLFYMDSVY